MGHGHEHKKMEIPDYRQWKIEGTPLQDVQERLARQGLRDPWLRRELLEWKEICGYCPWCPKVKYQRSYVGLLQESNEAWRYMGRFAKPVTFMEVIGKGFKWGFAAFVVALAIEYTLFPPKKDGGHH